MEEEAVVVKGGKSEKVLFIAVIIIIIALAAIFSLKFFAKPEPPKTIDDLHVLNLAGKLEPEKGQVVTGYSFVKVDNMWYTQIMSPKRSKLFDTAFRFNPNEVKDIPVKGMLNIDTFDNASDYYVTFNPIGSDLQYVALAVGDFNNNMLKIFEKTPIAACDKNETIACQTRPIITCDNTEEVVLYVREDNETAVIFEDNCLIVQGRGFDIIRATDKLLYIFYNILE